MLCSGCSTVEFTHNNKGKFYVKSDVLPTITNDSNASKPHITIKGRVLQFISQF